MPTYEYRCRNGHEFERILKVADYKTPQQCDICHCEGRRIMSLPRLMIPQEVRYDSPIDGRAITSEKARREDLARNNCRPYDPEQKKDYDRRVVSDERELEKSVDETVDRAWDEMPTRKRERLAHEIEDGAGIGVERMTRTD